MKLRILIMAIASVLSTQIVMATEQVPAHPVTTQTAKPIASTTVLKTEKDKVSYSIGIDLGQNFKAQNLDIDTTILAKGMQDGMTGTTPALTKQQMIDVLMAFQKEVFAKKQAEFNKLSADNKKVGDDYLAANKKKPGVITTASGLQYKIIDAGKGDSPADKDVVTVDYEGKLMNGKVFDSSYARKKPVTFPMTEVIPGWTEVLKLMKPGATFEVAIPANLAYGSKGMSNVIGPNETLLFKIHLISVKKNT